MQRVDGQKVKRTLRSGGSLPNDGGKRFTGIENKVLEHIQDLPQDDQALMQHERPQEEAEEEAARGQNNSSRKKIKERQRKRRGCIRHAGTVCGFPTEDIDAVIETSATISKQP